MQLGCQEQPLPIAQCLLNILESPPNGYRLGGRHDGFLYIPNTMLKLSLVFDFVLKNNTHQSLQRPLDFYSGQ